MFNKYLIVFFVSMVPLIELRGAIPIAAGMGLPFIQYYIIAIIGNMIPVPFIYFFARKILVWGADKPVVGNFFTWCLEKGEKGAPQVIVSRSHPDFVRKLLEFEIPEIYEGLIEIKSVSRDPGLRSKVAVMLGVILAGIIMALTSMGLFGALGALF